MKIVAIDNYARETVADRLVAENIKHEDEAKVMADALNADPKRSDARWFVVKPDDYRLSRGMADIVGEVDEPEQSSTMIMAPLPEGVPDTPEVRARLAEYARTGK